jgi:hypothetical protein
LYLLFGSLVLAAVGSISYVGWQMIVRHGEAWMYVGLWRRALAAAIHLALPVSVYLVGSTVFCRIVRNHGYKGQVYQEDSRAVDSRRQDHE